jgi:hypothetical protein
VVRGGCGRDPEPGRIGGRGPRLPGAASARGRAPRGVEARRRGDRGRGDRHPRGRGPHAGRGRRARVRVPRESHPRRRPRPGRPLRAGHAHSHRASPRPGERRRPPDGDRAAGPPPEPPPDRVLPRHVAAAGPGHLRPRHRAPRSALRPRRSRSPGRAPALLRLSAPLRAAPRRHADGEGRPRSPHARGRPRPDRAARPPARQAAGEPPVGRVGLRPEGTSFRGLLDSVRLELASAHLRDPEVELAEIAFLLGYSESSAFHRWFKRRTGRTPLEVRRESVSEASPSTSRAR